MGCAFLVGGLICLAISAALSELITLPGGVSINIGKRIVMGIDLAVNNIQRGNPGRCRAFLVGGLIC